MSDTTQTVIENLVFEGGGPKDAAFAGAIQVLDELGHYEHVENVAGTSSGSITAALLACGAGSEGLLETVKQTDFRKFVEDRGGVFGDLWRLFRGYGLHSGDGFTKILKASLKRYAGNSELTFADLEDLVARDPARFKSLSAVASNLTTQKPEVFDARRTPGTKIWQAIRASISLPIIFEPMKIGGFYYADGGLAWVYPVDLFDEKTVDPATGREVISPNPHTLGFYLLAPARMDSDDPLQPEPIAIHSLRSCGLAIASFLMEGGNLNHIGPDDRTRTVFIDSIGVSGTDFDVSKKQIEALIESGRKGMRAHFDRQR